MPNRVALITGGSGGIGRASALRLARDGFDVAVQFNGSRERAEEVVEQIATAGGRAIAVPSDVGDEQSVLALFDAVEAEFGGIDAVVHTAGIMPLAPLVDTDAEMFDRVVGTNIRGTFLVAREAARRARAGGSIVLFSTTITRLQTPSYGAYAMSKGAAEALPLILARELAGRDVTVNAVAPGPTDTPLFRAGKPQELMDRIAGLNPMGRLGTPDDIAQIVATLAGPARWINGQVLYVNGGAA
jgi:3-oxoacyl-[acyl-carrier protein] reductase